MLDASKTVPWHHSTPCSLLTSHQSLASIAELVTIKMSNQKDYYRTRRIVDALRISCPSRLQPFRGASGEGVSQSSCLLGHLLRGINNPVPRPRQIPPHSSFPLRSSFEPLYYSNSFEPPSQCGSPPVGRVLLPRNNVHRYQIRKESIPFAVRCNIYRTTSISTPCRQHCHHVPLGLGGSN